MIFLSEWLIRTLKLQRMLAQYKGYSMFLRVVDRIKDCMRSVTVDCEFVCSMRHVYLP